MESFCNNDSSDKGSEALGFMVQDGLGGLPPAEAGRGTCGTACPGDVGLAACTRHVSKAPVCVEGR